MRITPGKERGSNRFLSQTRYHMVHITVQCIKSRPPQHTGGSVSLRATEVGTLWIFPVYHNYENICAKHHCANLLWKPGIQQPSTFLTYLLWGSLVSRIVTTGFRALNSLISTPSFYVCVYQFWTLSIFIIARCIFKRKWKLVRKTAMQGKSLVLD